MLCDCSLLLQFFQCRHQIMRYPRHWNILILSPITKIERVLIQYLPSIL